MSQAAAVNNVLNGLGGVYRDPTRVYTDATALLRDGRVGRHLRPGSASLMEDNGTHHAALFVFQGTVPIVYRGAAYNIPVDIFLPPPYPLRPPICFVRPVATMAIKEGHRHVGRDGMVYLPYLHHWRANTHRLIEMVTTMSSVFASEPPVYAKPASTSVTPLTASVVTLTPVAQVVGSGTTTTTTTPPQYDEIVRAALAASKKEEDDRREKESEEQAKFDIAQRESYAEEQERRTTQETRERLTTVLRAHLKTTFDDHRASIRRDLRHKRQLEKNAEEVQSRVLALEHRRDGLRATVDTLDDVTRRLTTWTDEFTERQPPPGEEEDVDALVEAADVQSRQLLDLAAENAAITDCLYFLDKALVRGTVTLDVHLKKVRQLAKRQFLARAQLLKVAEVRSMPPAHYQHHHR